MICNGIVIDGVCRLTPSYVDGALHISYRAELLLDRDASKRIQSICAEHSRAYETEAEARIAIDHTADAIRRMMKP